MNKKAFYRKISLMNSKVDIERKKNFGVLQFMAQKPG